MIATESSLLSTAEYFGLLVAAVRSNRRGGRDGATRVRRLAGRVRDSAAVDPGGDEGEVARAFGNLGVDDPSTARRTVAALLRGKGVDRDAVRNLIGRPRLRRV